MGTASFIILIQAIPHYSGALKNRTLKLQNYRT